MRKKNDVAISLLPNMTLWLWAPAFAGATPSEDQERRKKTNSVSS
ncbi:exported hypothetical protein [Bradyrhizobium sp. ORS 375]|nr:exported hypothetical protein [Bradyrhizobium sp. ORS 375]